MSALLRKAALGKKITRFDKIKTLHTLEEIDGFAWGAKVSQCPLTKAEENALAMRRAQISAKQAGVV